MIGDIKKFRFWCQKVLPLVYDNSLSYYEVLCKVVQYLNGLIDDVNKIPEYIDSKIEEALSDEHILEILSQFITKIQNAISANNEGTNTNSSKDYNVGQMLWLNDTLYRVIRPISAGATFIVDTNIEAVDFETLFNDFIDEIKHDITSHDDGTNATATQNWTTGQWLWLNDVLYEVVSDITVGNAYVFSGDNANVNQITIEDMMIKETTARKNADTSLANDISAEATARNSADTALQGQINAIHTRYVFVDTTNNDITDAISTAINNASVGDIVYLPNGEYTISDYISISKNVNIIFDGVITNVNGTFNNVNNALFNFDSVENIEISLNVIDANYESTCNVIRLLNCNNINIHNCYIDIKQTGYDGCGAVNISTGSHDITIRDSFFRAEYGIIANDYEGIYNITIDNNVFKGGREYENVTHGDAIEFNTPTYGSDNIVITNNEASEFEYNVTYARTITFGFANAHNIRIANNHIYDCDTSALHFENGCNKVAIANNIFDNVYQGIMIIANTTRFNQDFDITNNIIKAYGKIANHDVDTGFAIVLNTGASTDLGFNCRINITDNNLIGGTNSSNGLCVYNALDVMIANNIIRNFARSGLDICVYSATTGPGIQNVNCHDNDISLCGWSARLGLRSYNATPYTIPNLIFKNNSLKGSTFNINILSCLGSSGIHDVEYRGQTGNSNYYSIGDIVINDPSDPSLTTGKITHKYCGVAGTPSTATLYDLY